MTQVAIAAMAGITPQAWNNYETARKRIDIDPALRLATVTGATLDFIYRGDLGMVPMDLRQRIQRIRAAREPASSRPRRSG